MDAQFQTANEAHIAKITLEIDLVNDASSANKIFVDAYDNQTNKTNNRESLNEIIAKEAICELAQKLLLETIYMEALSRYCQNLYYYRSRFTPSPYSAGYPEYYSGQYPEYYSQQNSQNYSGQYPEQYSDQNPEDYSEQCPEYYSDPFAEPDAQPSAEPYSGQYANPDAGAYPQPFSKPYSELYSEPYLQQYPPHPQVKNLAPPSNHVRHHIHQNIGQNLGHYFRHSFRNPSSSDSFDHPVNNSALLPNELVRHSSLAHDLVSIARHNLGRPVWAFSKFASLCQQGYLGCAATVSELLQTAGLEIKGSACVAGVVNELGNLGWHKIKIYDKHQFKAGDIVYGLKGNHAHIGIITAADNNQVLVCDNSSSSGTLKERTIESGGSFTPNGRFADSLYVMRQGYT
jgi:hypothetical protein